MTDGMTLTHYPRCFGCGAANERGLRLTVEWRDGEARCLHVPPPEAEGGPGIVHGGYLASLADEVMALVATRHGDAPAMSRRIEVDYKAPVLVGAPVEIRSWVEETGARSIVARLRASRPGGEGVSFEARGVFLRVSRRVWVEAMQRQGRGPDRIDWGGHDPSTFFSWQMSGLPEIFVAGRMAVARRIALEIEDVTPSAWTITAGPDGVAGTPGAAGEWDVRFTGTFQRWQQLVRRTLPLDELLADPAVRVEGDGTALAELAAALEAGPPR